MAEVACFKISFLVAASSMHIENVTPEAQCSYYMGLFFSDYTRDYDTKTEDWRQHLEFSEKAKCFIRLTACLDLLLHFLVDSVCLVFNLDNNASNQCDGKYNLVELTEATILLSLSI